MRDARCEMRERETEKSPCSSTIASTRLSPAIAGRCWGFVRSDISRSPGAVSHLIFGSALFFVHRSTHEASLLASYVAQELECAGRVRTWQTNSPLSRCGGKTLSLTAWRALGREISERTQNTTRAPRSRLSTMVGSTASAS